MYAFIDFSENRGMAGMSESEKDREGDSGYLDDEIALDQSAGHPSVWEHDSIDWTCRVL